MTKGIVFVLMASGFLVTAAAGCATKPKGPTPADLIAAMAMQAAKAMHDQDVDKLLANFSESFKCNEFPTKGDLKDFLAMAKQNGLAKGVDLNLQDAKTSVEKNTFTLSGVDVVGAFGQVGLSFEGGKINGEWKITGMSVY